MTTFPDIRVDDPLTEETLTGSPKFVEGRGKAGGTAMTTFPDIRVGDPLTHETLTVFPLFVEDRVQAERIEYLLSGDALESGTLTVEELGESGSVPELVVTNKGDSRVLFLEGEELRGAKQNRVLNTSVLVPAHSSLKIPVSCVEQGRWAYRSRRFRSEGTHSSSKLRRILKESVTQALASGGGHRSDQGRVWNEVSRLMRSTGSSSDTMAMADAYASSEPRMGDFRVNIPYVEGACGVAFAVAGKIVSLDLFDKIETCRKVWDRLMTGMVVEALETPAAETSSTPSSQDVSALINRWREAPPKPVPAVGEGEELRYESLAPTHASALVFQDAMIHASAITSG